MSNDLFTIGPITVHAYGLMIGIGIIAAYLAGHLRAEKKGLESDKLMDLIIVCVVAGFACAKLLYWITILPEILANPSIMLNFGSGFVVYGGIIGGVIGGYIFCRIQKYSFIRYADLLLPSVALAQGFGRIGCAIAGCCYGAETTCFCAVTYLNSSIAPNGVPLIPTQAISAGLNFLHFAVLVLIASKCKVPGVVTGCYLIFYSIGRFCIEMFRGDLIRGRVGTFSTSQFISLFIVIAGIAVIGGSIGYDTAVKRKAERENNL
ncbi:MAG: prolipoprotein diacylglyceryl transferase [Faecalibacterium sp.]